MKQTRVVPLLALLLISAWAHSQNPAPPPPVLEVDPYWPQLPETWIFGVGAGIAVDAQNNVWIIHRPGMVTEKKACCRPAPVVMQFDASGKLLQSWNGAGEGYEWPLDKNEHGIYVDHQNNVWIAGRGVNGTSENQILKFDARGKFLLQIGRRGKGTGSNDTANLGQPADVAVYPGTNEVFVADGYGNRRVIVFDAATGAYKRHWGAYGNRPDDAASREQVHQGPAASSSTRSTISVSRRTDWSTWRTASTGASRSSGSTARSSKKRLSVATARKRPAPSPPLLSRQTPSSSSCTWPIKPRM